MRRRMIHEIRRARLRRGLIAEEAEESPPPDLEERRRKFVFEDEPRLKPARLDDLKGLPHVREEIEKYIRFLKNIDKFKEKGVRTQPGVLFHGDPGTGKTLSARIIATESGARLINAMDFPRASEGWSAEDIMSLFALAREYHVGTGVPVIIYFDEIDSICPSEVPVKAEATVALMGELDGLMGKPEGILVIASTNCMSDVDEGVLRAGRIGHRIRFSGPDRAGIIEMLRHFMKSKPHEEIDFEGLADVLEGRTGAEVEEMVERAHLNACLDSPEPLLTEMQLIRQIVDEAEPDEDTMWEEDGQRYKACVHEAGHLLVGVALDMPPKMVVVSKARSKGVTMIRMGPQPPTREEIERRITAMFGGGLAEKMVFGSGSVASENDVEKATSASVKLIAGAGEDTNYLDGEIFDFHSPLHPISEEERAAIYRRAREVRERCFRRAGEILNGYGREVVERVARVLEEREFLLGADIVRVVEEAVNGGKVSEMGSPSVLSRA